LRAGGRRLHPLEPRAAEEPVLLAAHVDRRGTGHTQLHRAFLRPFLRPIRGLPLAAPAAVWVVGGDGPRRPRLRGDRRGRFDRTARQPARPHPLHHTCAGPPLGGGIMSLVSASLFATRVRRIWWP